MAGVVDLHIHTNFSDGKYSPEQIVRRAQRLGLKHISITDHDCVDAYSQAEWLRKEFEIDIIPGVELSSDIAGREVHILGYFFDPTDRELNKYLTFFRDERTIRAERMVAKLNALGYAITMDEVMDEGPATALGRPHIANALLKKGYVKTFQDAFVNLIGHNCPAYERKVHISPASAFKIISDAGGISFIAHPGNLDETLLRDLIDAGVDGIEVIHPSLSNTQSAFYKGVANTYFLLTSGGSDFHGGKRNDDDNFGKFAIPSTMLYEMKQRIKNK